MKNLAVFSFFFILILPLVSMAATNTFSIGVNVPDEEPPSTPTLLSVEPVSADQIDVDWSVSTDNLQLGGYVLLRDGLPIATTTITSYSDTGLSADSLYAYEVYAFDTSFNVSTTSNLLSTTTLSAIAEPSVVVATTSINNPISTQTVTLRELKIDTTEREVTFSWATTFPAGYVLRWGRTDAYQSGFITSINSKTKQWSKITELEPGTTYQYELMANTLSGMQINLSRGKFTTKFKTESKVVANVERLTAEVKGTDVLLNYFIPRSESGALVQVVRSHLGFPKDLNDGAVVYTGRSETVKDLSAFVSYARQYYSVFVIRTDGSVSSGAVVAIEKPKDVNSGSGEIFLPIENFGTASGSLDIDPAEDILIELLGLDDITVIQLGYSYTFLDKEIKLFASDAFTIRISRESLPDNLKTIIVTLLDPTDQRRSYSFLLRINKDGSSYEATIASLNVLGTSRLQVTVYDYEQSLIGRYHKQIDFVSNEVKEQETVIFPDALVESLLGLKSLVPIIIIIIILLLGGGYLFLDRRRNSEG